MKEKLERMHRGSKATSQDREYPLLHNACCTVKHVLTFILKKKKKVPQFACINILLINLNYVTPEFSFDGERQRLSSLFNLFIECHCGAFLPLLESLVTASAAYREVFCAAMCLEFVFF